MKQVLLVDRDYRPLNRNGDTPPSHLRRATSPFGGGFAERPISILPCKGRWHRAAMTEGCNARDNALGSRPQKGKKQKVCRACNVKPQFRRTQFPVPSR
jgi:hypothetical protein